MKHKELIYKLGISFKSVLFAGAVLFAASETMVNTYAAPTAAVENTNASTSNTNNNTPTKTDLPVTKTTAANGNSNLLEKNEVEVQTYPASNNTQQWKPSTSTNRTGEFTLQVSSGVTRLEVFYTAATKIPTITFSTTSGTYTYTTDRDEKYENGFKFITRKGLTTSNDNIRYMVIYIANTKDPGKWKMTVSVPDSLTEIACITTEVPDGWEATTGDMLCQGTGLLFYYVDPINSELKDNPIGNFNKLWTATYQLGVNDTIEEAPEEVKDNSGMIKFIVMMIILLALLSLISAMSARKKQNEQYRQKRQNIVKKENSKFKKQKSKESNELDEILNRYNDDYADDADDRYNVYEEDECYDKNDETNDSRNYNIYTDRTDTHNINTSNENIVHETFPVNTQQMNYVNQQGYNGYIRQNELLSYDKPIKQQGSRQQYEPVNPILISQINNTSGIKPVSATSNERFNHYTTGVQIYTTNTPAQVYNYPNFSGMQMPENNPNNIQNGSTGNQKKEQNSFF